MEEEAYLRRVWLQVSGHYACFTRPEMKVERVSYDVMTPSAARGVLEAILWKPAIRWTVERIAVLRPIQWASVKRNEVQSVLSLPRLRAAWGGNGEDLSVCIEEERVQRSSLVLKDVSYGIQASLALTERAGPSDTLNKFAGMFQRRAGRGQCFHQPYLGCREFSANFQLSDESILDEALPMDCDLGWMLYDIDYTKAEAPPKFFFARLKQGVIDVPSPEWEGLRS